MHYEREDGCRAWLCCGQLPLNTTNALLAEYGSAQALYERFVGEGGAFLRERLTPKQMSLLASRARPDAMHELMVSMRKNEMGILAQKDFAYPDALRAISDPPPFLFYRGNPDCLSGRCVTMIGSRRASPAGVQAAKTIARDLAGAGVTVVSGFALGIDSAAHAGCLEGRGPTCAVMACGLDVRYPAENDALREQILAGDGVLLSEYPPGERATGWHFPVRNRILSGLSGAVLFVEGRIRSGSMTTVEHALDQGRDVFAYPGDIHTSYSEGAHALLREGATYCTSAADLLDSMGWADDAPRASKTQADLPPLTREQQAVLARLAETGEMSFDQIAQATDLNAPDISAALTMLQLMGLVQPMPGKLFRRAG